MRHFLYIHGGMTHSTHENYLNYLRTRSVWMQDMLFWNQTQLPKSFENEFMVIRPKMPCKENAEYEAWKIVFERYVEQLDDGFFLMGSSLGGVFLARYLAENTLSKKPAQVYIMSAPFDDSLGEGEELCNGFIAPTDLKNILRNCPTTKFIFSKDDPVVPFAHAKKYQELLPEAEFIFFEDKGHFLIKEFPEMIAIIQEDLASLAK